MVFITAGNIHLFEELDLVRKLSIPIFVKVGRVKTELASGRYWNISVL